jgi:hypothetical protein
VTVAAVIMSQQIAGSLIRPLSRKRPSRPDQNANCDFGLWVMLIALWDLLLLDWWLT